MSRIGRKPIKIPAGVDVKIDAGHVRLRGPKGELEMSLPAGVTVAIDNGCLNVCDPVANRSNRGFQGLGRALLANMMQGVTEGYNKRLDICGVGYRAEVKGGILTLSVGLSHTVALSVPAGLDVVVGKAETVGGLPATPLLVSGIDKQLVGEFTARVAAVRPPEPYKGKGIKLAGRRYIRKAGKSGAK